MQIAIVILTLTILRDFDFTQLNGWLVGGKPIFCVYNRLRVDVA